MALGDFPTPLFQPVRPLELLEDEITTLAARLSAATYRLLELIAEFDRREGTDAEASEVVVRKPDGSVLEYVPKQRALREAGEETIQRKHAALGRDSTESRRT